MGKRKGDIGLTASKGQDSLVFFTHLTGPRWSRSTSPFRLRLRVSPSTLGLLRLLVGFGAGVLD